MNAKAQTLGKEKFLQKRTLSCFYCFVFIGKSMTLSDIEQTTVYEKNAEQLWWSEASDGRVIKLCFQSSAECSEFWGQIRKAQSDIEQLEAVSKKQTMPVR